MFIFHRSPFQNCNEVISCHFTEPSYWWEYANTTISHSQLYFLFIYRRAGFFLKKPLRNLLRLAASRRCLNHAGKEADPAADSCALISFLEKNWKLSRQSVCLLQELRVKHMILRPSCWRYCGHTGAECKQVTATPPSLTTQINKWIILLTCSCHCVQFKFNS